MPIIQAVDRALKILDLFDEYETELKITDISTKMALHKSTVHSLLKTLQKHNYIEQNPENGKYRLGMKLFERGNYVIHSLDLRTVAKPFLLELSKKTGLTVNLVILDGKEGIYIDKVEGNRATILYSRIGRRIPIHCSAVGKALVASKSDDEIDEILKGYDYVQHTEKTITSEDAFRQILEDVRKYGYAIDDQENEPGVYCVAIPIKNYSSQTVAAISMSTPASQLTEKQLKNNINLLKETGNGISQKLGYVYKGY